MVELMVRCNKCNDTLHADLDNGYILVEPCDTCICKEKDKSYKEGYENAEDDLKERG